VRAALTWQWQVSGHFLPLAHPTRFDRVTFAFGGQRFYVANRGTTFSTNRKNRETNELRDGGKSIGRMASGRCGARVGVPRILELLNRHGVKASFYVPAVAALLHTEEQQCVFVEGYKIGIHSWIHELNSVLPYEVERDLMFRSADTLEKNTGIRPVGLRSPSRHFSPNTLRIESELDLLYDSSLMGMDLRRRGQFHDAPLLVAAARYAAEGRARYLPARVRRSL
jgi:peptidoglycan/xylan/chitin deacetylase (PgdA/CDA1 family)